MRSNKRKFAANGSDNNGSRLQTQAHLPMTSYDLTEKAIALAYRIAAYALLNWVDDAAMLALIFC